MNVQSADIGSTKLSLLWLCVLLLLAVPSCRVGNTPDRVGQAITSTIASETNAVVSEEEGDEYVEEMMTSPSSAEALPLLTSTIDALDQATPPQSELATPSVIITDSQPLPTPTATVVPNVLPTSDPQAVIDFTPIIALKGKTTEQGNGIGVGYDEAALYDTSAAELTVVAQGISIEMITAPLWSPQGDFLAFPQSDHAIGLYDPLDGTVELLETARPNPPAGMKSKIGVALGGWSYDGDWLAYQYLYDAQPGESYLLNRHTTQNYLLTSLPTAQWLEWSPTELQIAAFSVESPLYIQEAPGVSGISQLPEATSYELENYWIYRIAWYPDGKTLLVSTGREGVLQSPSYLFSLDLDTGEWTSRGSFESFITDMAYSPDATKIALSLTSFGFESDKLVVLDASHFRTIAQIELPDGPLFSQIEWLDTDLLVLSTGDDLYVLSLNEPEQARWVLGSDKNDLGTFVSASITDWSLK